MPHALCIAARPSSQQATLPGVQLSRGSGRWSHITYAANPCSEDTGSKLAFMDWGVRAASSASRSREEEHCVVNSLCLALYFMAGLGGKLGLGVERECLPQRSVASREDTGFDLPQFVQIRQTVGPKSKRPFLRTRSCACLTSDGHLAKGPLALTLTLLPRGSCFQTPPQYSVLGRACLSH